MSSIAAPSRTDATPQRQLVGLVRTLLATIVLTVLLVTVTPFQVVYDNSGGGNVLNQVAYSGLAAVALLGHLLFTDRAAALSLLRPTWLLMALWLVAAALMAFDPPNALRAVLFTILAMIAATGALCLPPDPRSFRFALTIAALAALGLSYLGIIALPHLAIHQAGEVEAQHVGLWRGAYAHKNVAGAVMASLFFCGIYLLRCRWWLAGGAVLALSAIFVLQTGSKTAAGLLPAVALLVLSSQVFGARILPILVLSAALAGIGLMTLGTVLVPFLNDILQAVAPGTTYTGRTDLWRFALNQMQGHHLTGFGFESFWRTAVVVNTEPGDMLGWDPRGSPNAHNGFLDIAIAVGWPGLAIAVMVLVVLPFRDYVKSASDPESRRLADLFLMMLSFVLLNAFLETFFFDRANPVWMSAWIAIVGLRLLSRHRLVGAGPD